MIAVLAGAESGDGERVANASMALASAGARVVVLWTGGADSVPSSPVAGVEIRVLESSNRQQDQGPSAISVARSSRFRGAHEALLLRRDAEVSRARRRLSFDARIGRRASTVLLSAVALVEGLRMAARDRAAQFRRHEASVPTHVARFHDREAAVARARSGGPAPGRRDRRATRRTRRRLRNELAGLSPKWIYAFGTHHQELVSNAIRRQASSAASRPALDLDRAPVTTAVSRAEVVTASSPELAELGLSAGAGRVEMIASAPAPPASPPPGWEEQISRLTSAFGLEDPTDRPSLGIGPRNGNGQAWAWAQAARRASREIRVETFAAQFELGPLAMNFEADHTIPLTAWRSSQWDRWWARYVIGRFSHLLVEQGLTSCGRLCGKFAPDELPFLLDRGIKVGLVFRGSEIRDPVSHAAHHRWSPFMNADEPLTRRLREHVERLRQGLADFDVPTFVTTLDLLEDVPAARWLPHVIDLDTWRADRHALERSIPRVLHAPSREALKGSAAVDEACEALARLGRIEYVRIRGVPHSEMPRLLGER